MKKEYINPDMEVIRLNMSQPLLDSSLPKGTETIDDPNDILAPDLPDLSSFNLLDN